MQNVYSHDEIVAFVDGHLKRMGTDAMNDRKITSEVVGWISQLPPLFQVLTIGSHHNLVFADIGVMNRLFKETDNSFKGTVLGFYTSGEKNVRQCRSESSRFLLPAAKRRNERRDGQP